MEGQIALGDRLAPQGLAYLPASDSRQYGRAMRPAGAALLALLLSCAAPPGDECSNAKPCGAGSSCQAGRCVAVDGGPPIDDRCVESAPPGLAKNLIYNPGFECGDPPTAWYAQYGKLSITHAGVRTGAAAARLSDPDSGPSTRLWFDRDAVTDPGTRVFCARAWMRGSSDGRLTVQKVSSGMVNYDTYSSPMTPDWQVVPPPTYGAMKVAGAGEQRFLLYVWVPNPTPADWLEVDDVQLWESRDGGCVQR